MLGSSTADGPLAAGWGFWLAWVAAGSVGWAVGAAVAALASHPGIIVGGYVRLALGVVFVGGLQSLVLRGRVAQPGWWVTASIVAAAVVGMVVFGVGALNEGVGWVVGASLCGTVAGVLQWLLLRRQRTRAGWWVLASTVGWVAAMAVGAFATLDPLLERHPLLGWAALGAAYGAITGYALVWLLRQRPLGSEQ